MNSKKSDFYVNDNGDLTDIDGNLININGELIDEIDVMQDEEMSKIYNELEKSINELDIDDDEKKNMLKHARLFMNKSKESLEIIYELNNELIIEYKKLISTDDRIPEIDDNGLLTAITLLLMDPKFKERIQKILDKNIRE